MDKYNSKYIIAVYKLIVSLIRYSDMLETSTVAISLEKLSLFRLSFPTESAVLGA
jgi:hypothetical protein